MVVKTAWDVAQAVVNTMPPYLADDELTVDRLFERNKDKMSKDSARELLERLVEDGKLEKQKRRAKNGGRPVFCYVKPQKPSLGSE